MKIRILYFLSILIVTSCNKKIQNYYYYPIIQEFEKTQTKDTLKFTSFENFKELKKSMNSSYKKNNGKYPILLIEDRNEKFLIEYFEQAGCMPPIFKQKNLIGISKDSVYKSGKFYSIENLKKILKTDLLNNGFDIRLAESPRKLNIQFLRLNKETSENIEKSLLFLLRTYNEIKSETKDTLQLNVRFENLVSVKDYKQKFDL
jgi:hypothetical protein